MNVRKKTPRKAWQDWHSDFALIVNGLLLEGLMQGPLCRTCDERTVLGVRLAGRLKQWVDEHPKPPKPEPRARTKKAREGLP